ncbi:MAG: hypothetical protein LBC63_07215, partial [Holophagales bacterium]|nr:hypothetical protein [Holophagales bacterium]
MNQVAGPSTRARKIGLHQEIPPPKNVRLFQEAKLKTPLVYNAKSGPRWRDLDAILASMGAELRARVEAIEMSFPFDYSESIE